MLDIPPPAAPDLHAGPNAWSVYMSAWVAWYNALVASVDPAVEDYPDLDQPFNPYGTESPPGMYEVRVCYNENPREYLDDSTFARSFDDVKRVVRRIALERCAVPSGQRREVAVTVWDIDAQAWLDLAGSQVPFEQSFNQLEVKVHGPGGLL